MIKKSQEKKKTKPIIVSKSGEKTQLSRGVSGCDEKEDGYLIEKTYCNNIAIS